ncbi:hypothetical protein OH708_08255 [Pseudomonas capsici]|uniref:hypothetical protein n=1 Tax=Pseudomonas capsici TaxID=2810614 RepID=UPI0021F221BE|nr:hypothetical protein [Pseudomonas capsici]MCV4287894.1 hypothetical protein [Pseudomonas capsici]
MKNSQFNMLMAVLWLIAAGVQVERWLELACTIFFVIHGLKSLYWTFAERKGVRL